MREQVICRKESGADDLREIQHENQRHHREEEGAAVRVLAGRNGVPRRPPLPLVQPSPVASAS
jgi:hypothetical protein